VLVVIAASILGLVVAPALGGAGTSTLVILDYPYGRQCPAAGFAEQGDRWNMNTCNCTSYVAWALAANGRRVDWFRLGEMDAHNWPRVAAEAGFGEGTAARVAAVAVWPHLSRPWGHVAFVTAVHPDGSFDVAEYNLRRRFRFDARSHVSPVGVTFIYVPPRSPHR
jgi:surface antigen